jgi:hypothetical protein
MTNADALAALAAARMALFQASQRRMQVVTRQVRIQAPETLDQINDQITAARQAVMDATAAVIANPPEAN